jgi:TfoX/Sxy family transcriptional regulator of competence genes
MAYDEKLAERISKILKGKRGLVEKKMFGGIAYMLKDKMFVGIAKNQLMVRVLNERYEEYLKKPHAKEMDFTGRPLKGFLYISEDGIKTDKQLSKWIDAGIEFVMKSLPKKKIVKKSVKKSTKKK